MTFDRQAQGEAAQLPLGDVESGQGRIEIGSGVDVVVACDRDVVRYRQPDVGKALDGAQREIVVGADDGAGMRRRDEVPDSRVSVIACEIGIACKRLVEFDAASCKAIHVSFEAEKKLGTARMRL